MNTLWWTLLAVCTSTLMFVSPAISSSSSDSLLLLQQVHQRRRRKLQDLPEIWWFRHETTYEVLPPNNTTSTLRFSYRTSDYIQDDMTRAIILDAETCNIPIYNTEQHGFSLKGPISNNLPGDGYGFRDWMVDLDIMTAVPPPPSNNVTDDDNVTALIAEGRMSSSSNSLLPSIYKEESIGGNHTIGIWHFCLLIGLFSDGTSNAGLVNWEDFEVQIEEDYDIHTLEVTKFERQPSHILPEAHTYFCDNQNIEIEPHPLLVEGTELRICVVPPDNTYEMITIDSFQFEAVTEDGRRPTKQAAINEGQPARNSLTSFDCTGDICVIRSLLLSSFYTKSVEVFANGYSVFRKSSDTTTENDDEGGIIRSRISLEFETLLQIYDRTAHPSSMPSASPTTMPTTLDGMTSSSSAMTSLWTLWMSSFVTTIILTWNSIWFGSSR